MNVWAKFSLKFDKNLSQFACLYRKRNLNFKPFVAFFKPYKKIKKSGANLASSQANLQKFKRQLILSF